ncbi:hypothetical protein MASR1M68_08670 [Elusimicrobiota bacterium]
MKTIVERQLKKELFQDSVFRKTLVAFVFLCMLVNGFTPRSEEGRNSLFVVMASAMQNAVVEVFVSCNEALTSISNKISNSIYSMIMSEGFETRVPLKTDEEKGSDPVNRTSDNGIMTERRAEIKAGYNRIEEVAGYISFIMTGKLYKLYENMKVSCEDNKVGILLFVLFAIYTVRRKEISENIKKMGYKRLALVR